jgi:hypothetical protein
MYVVQVDNRYLVSSAPRETVWTDNLLGARTYTARCHAVSDAFAVLCNEVGATRSSDLIAIYDRAAGYVHTV